MSLRIRPLQAFVLSAILLVAASLPAAAQEAPPDPAQVAAMQQLDQAATTAFGELSAAETSLGLTFSEADAAFVQQLAEATDADGVEAAFTAYETAVRTWRDEYVAAVQKTRQDTTTAAQTATAALQAAGATQEILDATDAVLTVATNDLDVLEEAIGPEAERLTTEARSQADEALGVLQSGGDDESDPQVQPSPEQIEQARQAAEGTLVTADAQPTAGQAPADPGTAPVKLASQESADSGSLPFTGSSTFVGVVAALTAMAAGSLILLLVHRHRRGSTAA